MMRHSFHNHTYLCKHAEGTVSDYVQAAVDQGLSSIGISEHLPFPDARWDSSHMDFDKLDEYVQAVYEAKILFPDIAVFLGGEFEWVEQFHDYYDELFEKYRFDYCIGAPHWTPMEDGSWLGYTRLSTAAHLHMFASHVQDIIESGKFLFIAHPDVFLSGYTRWDENTAACARDIIECAVSNGKPLEMNLNGLRKKKIRTQDGSLRHPYPVREFWEAAAELGAETVVGSDAHTPKDLTDSSEICFKWIRELGLADCQDALYKTILNKSQG